MIQNVGRDVPEGKIIVAALGAQISKESSTVLARINDLSVPLEAGASYLFRAFVPFEAEEDNVGFKFGFDGPAATVSVRSVIDDGINKLRVVDRHDLDYEEFTAADIDAGTHFMTMEGMIRNVTASGVFYISYAQGASSADSISLLLGAYIQLTRIG